MRAASSQRRGGRRPHARAHLPLKMPGLRRPHGQPFYFTDMYRMLGAYLKTERPELQDMP